MLRLVVNNDQPKQPPAPTDPDHSPTERPPLEVPEQTPTPVNVPERSSEPKNMGAFIDC